MCGGGGEKGEGGGEGEIALSPFGNARISLIMLLIIQHLKPGEISRLFGGDSLIWLSGRNLLFEMISCNNTTYA